ncbi:MAG: hypothetical protein AABZ12_04190 [Planctomycetota bacterium]
MKRETLWIVGLGVGLATWAGMGCVVDLGGQEASDNGSGDGTGNGGDVPIDTSNFAVFTDPDDPTFSTMDVHDVDEQVVRFDTQTGSIVWVETDASLEPGSWVVDGNFIGAAKGFQVRFGTKAGVPTAYFTETGPATICDIEAVGDALSVTGTLTPVPQE